MPGPGSRVGEKSGLTQRMVASAIRQEAREWLTTTPFENGTRCWLSVPNRRTDDVQEIGKRTMPETLLVERNNGLDLDAEDPD